MQKSATREANVKSDELLKAELKTVFGDEFDSFNEELQKLVREVSDTRKSVESYSRAVLALRSRYYLMCKAQKEIREVLADPNLNLDLMELEENLLMLKLSTIE